GSAREADSIDRDFSPRRSYRDSGYGEGWQGDDHFSTGVFGGGADQDYRSGGQYQGESGHGARPAYGGDFSGGGYLGRGTGGAPRTTGGAPARGRRAAGAAEAAPRVIRARTKALPRTCASA